ncbi:MAG: hypothetical protein AB7H92_17610, partial [Microbacteriaceae bacterium]
MSGWTSLAQWVGTKQGTAAIARVAEVWPGYERHAQRASINAYYTDRGVVDAVWAWLADRGVAEGHAFEPGVGRGDWISAAPAGVTWDAVDIDPVTVQVARWLTGANVHECPIEEWDVGQSSRDGVHGYDLIAGNVPFAAIRPAVNNPHRDSLHNLAIARSVGMLRPGGIATVITSRYTLDSRSAAFRARLAGEVDLVGAFRLPSGTHREAGTDVVTDLLVLRRPLVGEERPEATWVGTTTHEVDGVEIVWNRHWAEYPERVLGRVEPGGAYRGDDFHIRASEPSGELLADALDSIATLDYRPQQAAPARAGAAAVRSASGRRLPAGSITVDPASPTGFSRDGTPHRCAAKNAAQLAGLCGLRDAALDYLDAPSEEGRSELLGLYLAYRESYPPLNTYTLVERRAADTDTDDDDSEPEPAKTTRRYSRLEGFRTDPSWWNVAALEDFDDDTGQARPAAVLLRDAIVETAEWPTDAHDVAQAAINSLSRWHRIDVAYVADQLGVTPDTAEGELASIAYLDPATREWELSGRYLSGDVVGRLDAARAAVEGDGRFARNVADLTAVLPTPLTAAEISAEFGVTWLEPDDIGAFLREHGGGDHLTVLYHPPTGEWSHNGWAPAGPAQYHRESRSMTETVLVMCNGKPATVWTEIEVADGRKIRVVDQEATSAEQLARDNLTEALQAWVWADPERTDRLVARYNRMFNRYVAEVWDGSHLVLPGLAGDFTPRPHQKDVVWRI